MYIGFRLMTVALIVAIVTAAQFIKSCFDGDSKAPKVIVELDRIIAEESRHKPRLKQYDIFDYL